MLPRIPCLDHYLFRFVCRLVPRIPWLDAPGRLVPRIPWLDTTTVVTWGCPTYPVAGLFPHHTLGCLVPRIPWLDEAVAAWDCPTHPVAGLLSSRVLSLLCTLLLPCLPPARNCQISTSACRPVCIYISPAQAWCRQSTHLLANRRTAQPTVHGRYHPSPNQPVALPQGRPKGISVPPGTSDYLGRAARWLLVYQSYTTHTR